MYVLMLLLLCTFERLKLNNELKSERVMESTKLILQCFYLSKYSKRACVIKV